MMNNLKDSSISVLLHWPADEDEGEIKLAYDVHERETVAELLTRLFGPTMKHWPDTIARATVELRVKHGWHKPGVESEEYQKALKLLDQQAQELKRLRLVREHVYEFATRCTKECEMTQRDDAVARQIEDMGRQLLELVETAEREK
jgi:hypothetical protein